MIFRLTPSGTFTAIYRFVDGKGTHATSLIQATDGNFYGTAAGDSSGGFFNNPPSMHNTGIFFRLTPAGVFTEPFTTSPAERTEACPTHWSKAQTETSTAARSAVLIAA